MFAATAPDDPLPGGHVAVLDALGLLPSPRDAGVDLMLLVRARVRVPVKWWLEPSWAGGTGPVATILPVRGGFAVCVGRPGRARGCPECAWYRHVATLPYEAGLVLAGPEQVIADTLRVVPATEGRSRADRTARAITGLVADGGGVLFQPFQQADHWSVRCPGPAARDAAATLLSRLGRR